MAINKETGREDPFVIVGLCLFVPALLFFMMWLVGSHKIVAASAPMAYQLSKLWLIFPGGREMVLKLAEGGREFMGNPRAVTFSDWLLFINLCLKPLARICGFIVLLTAIPMALLSDRKNLFRRLSPTQLMGELSQVFTGVIPVMHLRMKLVADELPLWRRQTFPHEFLEKEKTFDGRRLLRDGEIQQEALRDRLIGIDPKKVINGKAVSLSLGRQIVNLAQDRERLKQICFPDRMSDVGKVLYALLVAHAYGGSQGIKDYRKAVDELNRSCAGESNGRANLSVAQWIFDKYRENADGRNLFAVHHWEYTYLVELLKQAKKQGKCGHTSFMWVKPMNRVLFYALNQVGRWVPHAESAAVFDHHAAEQLAARNGLVFMKPVDGRWVSTVWVGCAVEGFTNEWARWSACVDDNVDLWNTDRQWKLLSRMDLSVPSAVVPEGAAAAQVLKASAFDTSQQEARSEEEKARRTVERDAAVSEFIGSGGGAPGGAGGFQMM